jgi:hypothetical protein
MTDTTDVKNELEQDEAKKVIKETEGPLKAMLVNYVGQVLTPEDGQVTVEMIIQTLASEFPEFLLVVARENWIRGYEQALIDVENVEKERVATMKEDAEKIKAAEEKKINAKYSKSKKSSKKTKKSNERVSKEA